MADSSEAGRLNNLGVEAIQRGERALSVTFYRRAVALDPQPHFRVNLASQLVVDGQVDEAEALIADIDPRDKQLGGRVLWIGGGIAAYRRDLVAAANHFRDAMDRGIEKADHDLAVSVLQAGDWPAGWAAHERLEQPRGPWPKWTGERTKRLLVYADQGAGDIIMFSRLLPWAAGRVERLIVAVPWHLRTLLSVYGDIAEVVSNQFPVTATAQIELSGVARLFGMRPGSPPDPGLLKRAVVPTPMRRGSRKAVGLAWAGNKSYPRDEWRSMPFAQMLPLTAVGSCDFHSLQDGRRAADIASAGASALVNDLSGMMSGGWEMTACLVAGMGAVVTVDTAIAHLAGALGVKTFLCLPYLPDWRWGLEGETTAWYPSVTLVRQEKPGDWAGVIDRVAAKLAA
jgi:hypothetical protein